MQVEEGKLLLKLNVLKGHRRRGTAEKGPLASGELDDEIVQGLETMHDQILFLSFVHARHVEQLELLNVIRIARLDGRLNVVLHLHKHAFLHFLQQITSVVVLRDGVGSNKVATSKHVHVIAGIYRWINSF